MPNWNEILYEINASGSTHDVVRRKYLRELYELTDRNVILYYSGYWDKRQMASAGVTGFEITDADKNGFMTTIHQMDRSKGLDLILHTPGGEIGATESLVDYLRAMFGTDIRVIVPQIAMSAGTMIACASKEIVMGAHSNLGPIDPLVNGLPAHGIIEEVNRAKAEVAKSQLNGIIWQMILQKYHPTLIGECEKAIAWSNEVVRRWLETGMFAGDTKAKSKIDVIMAGLSSPTVTYSHSRHISLEKARFLGLKVMPLESDQALQEAVLTLHHACIHTMRSTPAIKLIENHMGVASVDMVLTPVNVAPINM